MPSLEVETHTVPGVAAVGGFLGKLLSHAETVKPSSTIEPALEKADFDDLQNRLSAILPATDLTPGEESADQKKAHRFAIIETAVRDLFSNLVVST
jgi:THO complex subunit 1